MGFTVEPSAIDVINKAQLLMPNGCSLLRVYLLAGEIKVVYVKPLYNHRRQN